jgi:2-phosphosulfolactate phosphatase
MQIHVHLLPSLTSPQELAGFPVVVIDVLRATTTMVYALAAGASQIIPCLDIAEARDIARRRVPPVVLGGERGGRKIKDFDVGNSPTEYTSERVSAATIVFTTTNGTSALRYTTAADPVLLGAFVNLSAVAAQLSDFSQVHLLCAGTGGAITREDTLLAGAIVERLVVAPGREVHLDDPARLAHAAWLALGDDRFSPDTLTAALRQTQGGRNLIAIGMEADLACASQIDQFAIVPYLERSTWTIRGA